MGPRWDPLLAQDRDGALVNIMNQTSDGDYQTFRANDGKYVREHFFGRDPRTREMVKDWTDEDIWWQLKRAATTTARCTRPTRPRWSTPASRP